MANSGIYWIDIVFNVCVKILYDIAAVLGITYEEINVWLFCIIWPILTLYIGVEIIRLRVRVSRLDRQANRVK